MRTVFLTILFAFVFSVAAIAGPNKGSARIVNVVYTAPNTAQVEYEVSYTGTRPFFLDQIFLDVNLGSTVSSLNNAVQTDAQSKINEEFGPNTITDKNDVRLLSGFVS